MTANSGIATVAVIPARGGSKGVLRKNVRPLAGVPLVARAVRAALAARSVDLVVVSTDDDEIAAVASAHGAIIIRRPAAISGDTASSESALLHALDDLAGRGIAPSTLVFLQCTSPFTRGEDIDAMVRGHAAGGRAVRRLGRVQPRLPLDDRARRHRARHQSRRDQAAQATAGHGTGVARDRRGLCHGRRRFPRGRAIASAAARFRCRSTFPSTRSTAKWISRSARSWRGRSRRSASGLSPRRARSGPSSRTSTASIPTTASRWARTDGKA